MEFKVTATVEFIYLTDEPDDHKPSTIVSLVEAVRDEVEGGEIDLNDYRTTIRVNNLEVVDK